MSSKKNKTPTICWNAIVKNESAIIQRCMEAMADHIDYWVIVDTGSTDGTQTIIQEFMAERGIAGELHEMPWKDFGYNRSRAVELAEGKADYLLFCDADMFLEVNNPDWKTTLKADSYYVTQYTEGGLGYQNIRLVNARLKGMRRWRYWGATHEYIDAINSDKNSQDATATICFKDFGDGGAKADKYERDIKLLYQQLEELEALKTASKAEHAKAKKSGLLAQSETLLPRTLFYLAQSYRDSEDYENALDVYRARVEAGGWVEEIWYSMYQVGILLSKTNQAASKVTHALLEAWEFHPQRAEPLWFLARYYRLNEQYQRAYLFAKAAANVPMTEDILFIERDVYQWKALDELAIAAYWTGRYQESRSLCERIIKEEAYPAQELSRLKENLSHAEAKLQE